MEIAKDKYVDLGINYERANKSRKRKGILASWIKRHALFTTIVGLALTFSIINIILIIKFFTILANL